MKIKFLSIISLLCMNMLYSQNIEKQNKELSIVFGLSQPIATNGFNFEINYWTKNFVIDYSHGFGLEFKESLVSDEAKKQRQTLIFRILLVLVLVIDLQRILIFV